MNTQYFALPFLVATLAGCLPATDETTGSGDDGDSINQSTIDVPELILDRDHIAAIGSVSPDWSTSDIALAQMKVDGSVTLIEGVFDTTNPNDIGVASNGDDLYRLGKYGFDNITKFGLSDLTDPDLVWQYSVAGGEGSASANPYDLVFEDDSKAYVLRYGLPNIWVVDPSVVDSGSDAFKQGEIDLSHYSTESNSTPNMTDALIHDGQLYVLVQRLESDFSASASSYVVVLDLSDLSEVETGQGEGNLKGINLGLKNAANLDLHNGQLYVAARGNSAYEATEGVYDGGIASIDLATYEVSTVIDDGTDQNHPYGQIQGVEIVNDDHGYFVGRASYGNDTLYHFNPSDLGQSITAIEDLSGVSISDIAHESLDDADAVYQDVVLVAVHASSSDQDDKGRIEVVNILDQSVFATLEMSFNPTEIEILDR